MRTLALIAALVLTVAPACATVANSDLDAFPASPVYTCTPDANEPDTYTTWVVPINQYGSINLVNAEYIGPCEPYGCSTDGCCWDHHQTCFDRCVYLYGNAGQTSCWGSPHAWCGYCTEGCTSVLNQCEATIADGKCFMVTSSN